MADKIFLLLLTLYGIWSHGIIGTIADEQPKNSSDLLVRQKRVVSYLSGEDVPVNIREAPYVVYIKYLTGIRCVGSILSPYVVISAVRCVQMTPQNYEVISSTSRTRAGTPHNVIEIRKRIGDQNHSERALDGIGLLIVNPRFVYSLFSRPISLHIGPLLIGSIGKVHGWGFNFRSANRGTNITPALRSIEVPVISHESCVNRYRPHREVSEKNVCTFHPNRHCGHNDFGAGLVVDGRLAGVFLWSGIIDQTDPQYPDVFASLQDPYYNQWIRSNLQSINALLENLYHH